MLSCKMGWANYLYTLMSEGYLSLQMLVSPPGHHSMTSGISILVRVKLVDSIVEINKRFTNCICFLTVSCMHVMHCNYTSLALLRFSHSITALSSFRYLSHVCVFSNTYSDHIE